MKRWQLSLGLATTALAAALIAPRLLPLLTSPPSPDTPVAAPLPAPEPIAETVPTSSEARTIDLVIALDTSGSMERLIDSTRTRIWDIVNEIDAQDPEATLRVGLVAYGSPSYGQQSGYVRTIMPLTEDLDALYTAAWSLTTDGGDEYVGSVIRDVLTGMDWAERDDRNRRLLFVAGNETAALGPVPYQNAAAEAFANGIHVSTLFAGNDRSGRNLQWDRVASIGRGRYMAIDANLSAVAVRSPYDDQIEALNTELNGTYVAGDHKGSAKLETLLDNDRRANALGGLAGRVASKSSAKFKTDSWDLVDKVQSGTFAAGDVDATALPEDLAKLDAKALEAELKDRGKRRAATQDRIQALQKQRSTWLADQADAEEGAGMDEAMTEMLSDLL